MGNENDEDADIEDEDQEITGVEESTKNDEQEELGRWKRKRLRNPNCFDLNTINTNHDGRKFPRK